MAEQRVIQTDEVLPLSRAIPLSLQHLMAMFGATVLVPILTGLDVGVGLMTSGIGTILYLIATRNKIPSYLGSSFAFIVPLVTVIGGNEAGIPGALGGLVAAGFVYMIVAAIVKATGTGWIERMFPPVLIGSVVIVIGIALSSVAVKMSLYDFADPANGLNPTSLIIAAITLASTIIFSTYFKGFIKAIPILLGIIVGYIAAILFGIVDFTSVMKADWIGLPNVTFPSFDMAAILIIAPVALVVIVEHIGHLLVINEITGKDFTPMLPESLFGDGLATAVSGMLGGTPSTTYAENIGVMAVTRVYATQLFWYAGAFAFLIGGFIPKFTAAINTIPTPVMGGVSLLLFGLIASSGLRLLVSSGVDFSENKNLIIASVVLVVGIGMDTIGATIMIGSYSIPGMTLATVLGVILNFVLPADASDSPVAIDAVAAE